MVTELAAGAFSAVAGHAVWLTAVAGLSAQMLPRRRVVMPTALAERPPPVPAIPADQRKKLVIPRCR
jgi:hypothetical protein